MSSDTSPDPPLEGRPIGRRAFLGLVGLGLSALAWGGSALRGVSDATNSLPAFVKTAVPLGDGWRIYAVNPPYPRFDPATWRLEIGGMVRHPQTLDLAALRALPQAIQTTDFHCVTGWSVPGVHWAGVRFADLLRAAEPLPGAKALAFVSAETPYVDYLTLEQAGSHDAMLAYDMDHVPLTRDHGAPARLVMPRMYGYKGVKWVQRIELLEHADVGYWEQRGYDRDAWVGSSNGY